MHEAEVYVVRVYRRAVSGVSGVVEDVQNGTSKAFRGANELVALIVSQPSPSCGTPDLDESPP